MTEKFCCGSRTSISNFGFRTPDFGLSYSFNYSLFIITYSFEKMREDKQLLMITHLSQLLDLVTGVGGFIVPLVIWITQKDKVLGMDTHGKMVLNFQISMFIYCIIAIPLIFLLGLGILIMIVIGLIMLIFPIVNAIKVSNDQIPSYPFTIEFLK